MKKMKAILDVQQTRIGVCLESIDGVKATYSTTIIDRMLDGLANIVAVNKQNKWTVKPLNKKATKFIEEQGYVASRGIKVFRPVGLNVTYGEYVETLKEISLVTAGITDKVIKPAHNFIGECLNDPTKLSSLSSRLDMKLSQDDLDVLKAKLASCYSKTSVTDSYNLGEASKSLVDLKSSYIEFSAHATTGIIKSLEEVEKDVKDMLKTVNGLVAALDNDEYQTANKKAIALLREAIYNTAQWVDFHAVVVEAHRMLAAAMIDTEAHLMRVGK